MGFVKEFREFAMKGSVIDLAVGVIIGGAFQKIIDSAVGDLLMPLLGKASGGMSFKDMYAAPAGQDGKLPLEEAQNLGAGLAYGRFMDTAIQFILMAFAVFVMIKTINKMKRPEVVAPAETPADVALLTEIRDLLRK